MRPRDAAGSRTGSADVAEHEPRSPGRVVRFPRSRRWPGMSGTASVRPRRIPVRERGRPPPAGSTVPITPSARVAGQPRALVGLFSPTHPRAVEERPSELITLSRSGRLAMRQMLGVYLRRVDRDGDPLPFRLYPLRPAWSEDRKPIVIDPRISFGRPTVACLDRRGPRRPRSESARR